MPESRGHRRVQPINIQSEAILQTPSDERLSNQMEARKRELQRGLVEVQPLTIDQNIESIKPMHQRVRDMLLNRSAPPNPVDVCPWVPASEVLAVDNDTSLCNAGISRALQQTRDSKAMQSNAKQSKAKQCKAMQSKAKQCKAMQSNAKQCKAMQSIAKQRKGKQCKAMQSNAKQCRAMQSKASQSNAKQSEAMQSNAKPSKAKQRNVKPCKAMEHNM